MDKNENPIELAELSDEEIERQWRKFETKHFKEKAEGKISWLKVAATFLGIVMITGAAFAFIHVINDHSQSTTANDVSLTAEREMQTVRHSNAELADTTAIAQPDETEVVEFDDVELCDILEQMANHYHLTLRYEGEQSKHVRLFFKWDKQADISSVVKLLNTYKRIDLKLEDETLIVK